MSLHSIIWNIDILIFIIIIYLIMITKNQQFDSLYLIKTNFSEGYGNFSIF
jgi:hypothetical protein